MLEANSHKKSSFSPTNSKSNSKRVSDEEMKKYTGLIKEQLMARDDKNRYRRDPAFHPGDDGAAMMIGMQGAAMGGRF